MTKEKVDFILPTLVSFLFKMISITWILSVSITVERSQRWWGCSQMCILADCWLDSNDDNDDDGWYLWFSEKGADLSGGVGVCLNTLYSLLHSPIQQEVIIRKNIARWRNLQTLLSALSTFKPKMLQCWTTSKSFKPSLTIPDFVWMILSLHDSCLFKHV